MPTAVVSGVSGVTGRAVAAELVARGWRVLGLSRTPPTDAGLGEHRAVDLSDPARAAEGLADLTDATHLFHCAFDGRGDYAAQVAPNLALLVNAAEALAAVAAAPLHVNLMQGTKVYGSHIGPFETPAREDDPRHMPPNFYYDQEDYLRAGAARGRWTWTAARPHAVCGFALGTPMNLAMGLGVYAAISAELGLPLRFPGTAGAWNALYQVVDAAHLARAAVWMATDPACANEAFNIVNGEPFRWRRLWPGLAEALNLPAGPPKYLPLTQFMADKAPLWDRIVARHGLQPIPYAQAAAWPFLDYVWATDWDCVSSMRKARRFGFRDEVDDAEMFARLFAALREARALP
ncbi:MAG: SDR family oxidoreductase [Pseudomonadota bacterium]